MGIDKNIGRERQEALLCLRNTYCTSKAVCSPPFLRFEIDDLDLDGNADGSGRFVLLGLAGISLAKWHFLITLGFE